MKNENLNKFQQLLQKKQKFTNKAVEALQAGDDELAEMYFNFDSGFNIEIIKLFQIPEEMFEDVVR